MISDMTIILFLALMTALVVTVERQHRRTSGMGLPRAPHGSDSSIAFTHLDHDWERVVHETEAHPA
jgi:hypothetical protein